MSIKKIFRLSEVEACIINNLTIPRLRSEDNYLVRLDSIMKALYS